MDAVDLKALSLSRDEISSIYKNIFQSDSGKLIFADLKHRCFVKRPTVDNLDVVDSNNMIYREGMRAVFLHIESMIEHEPEQGEQEQ